MALKIKQIKEKEGERFRKQEWNLFGQEVGIRRWPEHKTYTMVAYDNNRIVGYMHFSMIAGVAKLRNIIVKKGLRGKGIGSALLEKFEALAKAKHCHKLILYTTERHKGALAFYKKKGYKVEAELRDDWFHFKTFRLYKKI